MFKWFSGFRGGSGRRTGKVRRPLCRSATGCSKRSSPTSSIAVLFQPQIEPASGAHRRRRGAGPLGRRGIVAAQLFARAAAAGLAERLSRLVQRKALRIAAAWEGPLTSSGCRSTCCREDLRATGYDRWLLEEIAAAGIDPERITVEITESACWPTSAGGRRAAGAAARAPGCASRSTISAPAMRASPI